MSHAAKYLVLGISEFEDAKGAAFVFTPFEGCRFQSVANIDVFVRSTGSLGQNAALLFAALCQSWVCTGLHDKDINYRRCTK